MIAEWKVSPFKARDSIDAAYNSYYEKKEGVADSVLQNSAFKYIDNHLGYRYVLRESNMMDSLGIGSILQLNLKIQNVGFGNMTKKRKVTLILRPVAPAATAAEPPISPIELKLDSEFDPQKILSRKVELVSSFDENGNIADYDNIQTKTTFDGVNNVKLQATLPKDLAEGEYEVFLRISQYGNWPADSNYSTIRFANDSNYYDLQTGSNYVGKFVLSKDVPVTEAIFDNGQNPSQLEIAKILVEGNLLKVQNADYVAIFNALGHRLFEKNLNQSAVAVSLQKFPKGMLVVRAQQKGKVVVRKVKW